MKATLIPSNKKHQIMYEIDGEKIFSEEMGRIAAKKIMRELKEKGYKTFNQKKGGEIIECSF